MRALPAGTTPARAAIAAGGAARRRPARPRAWAFAVLALLAVLGVFAAAQPAVAATRGTTEAQPAARLDAAGAPSAIPDPPPHPVLLIGVAGLTWEDIDAGTTPNLRKLAERGAIASLTARSVRTTSCPVDGWLAVGAGRRAADDPSEGCRQPAAPEAGLVPEWETYRARALADHYDARPGSLGDQLADKRTAAIGPGAAIGLADSAGRIADYSPVPADPAALGSLLAAKLTSSDVVALDLGTVAGASPGRLAELDAMAGAALAAAGAHTSPGGPGRQLDVIVASIADGDTSAHMQFAAITGPDGRAGLLTSESTRQPGLLQTLDLAPTILRFAGVPVPDSFSGSWAVAHSTPHLSPAQRIQHMNDRESAVAAQAALSSWFFPVFCFLILLVILAAVFPGRRYPARTLPVVKVAGVFCAAVPVSTYLVNLVPWPRSAHPQTAMILVLLGFTVVLSAVALLGPWRRSLLGPTGVIGIVTVVTLAADVLTGSRLQMSTLLGEPLLIASRFYGIGNSAYALFSTALFFSLVVVLRAPVFASRPAWRTGCVVVVALLAGVLLGTPGLGTKFGSIPTVVIGFSLLAMAAAGLRLTFKRAVLIVLAAGVLMLGLLFADWLRPADERTHFGRFFVTILSGQAGQVFWRKIDMNVNILTGNWMTLLLPVFVLITLLIVIAPNRFRVGLLDQLYRRVPLLKPALISLFALLILGAFVNDSGIVVPAVGILMLIPVLLHLIAAQALTPAPAEPPAALRPAPPAGRL